MLRSILHCDMNNFYASVECILDPALKKYPIEVNVTHRPDGTARPNSIKFEDNERYEINRVIQKCRAASTKVGGTGIRYTEQISGQPTFLFDEANAKWFVEAKS